MAGSVVGHGISNMLFGGRSAEQQAPPPAEYASQARETTGNCDIPAKGTSFYDGGNETDGVDFTKCLEATGGDMTSCGYYLEALSTSSLPLQFNLVCADMTIEACQAAAKPY
jgi:hypothetical protein